METIKIILFSLGTFFGIENSFIAAEKVTITIHPKQQEVTINHHDLFTVILDSTNLQKLDEEWALINDPEKRKFVDEIAQSPIINFTITEGGRIENKETLNANIVFNYLDNKTLSAFALNVVDDHFSLINITHWNITTEDGTLNGNYWNFPIDKPFTFTLEPFTNMTDEYKEKRISLYDRYRK